MGGVDVGAVGCALCARHCEDRTSSDGEVEKGS